MVNSKEKMPLTDASQKIDRLKEIFGVKSDGQLAEKLQLKRAQSISSARISGDVPPAWLEKASEITGVSMDWIKYGIGPKLRPGLHTFPNKDNLAIKEDDQGYDLHGGWKPRPLEDLLGDTAGFLSAAVRMLIRIYDTNDEMLIRAITANLEAFSEVADRRRRENDMSMQMEKLQKELTDLKQQLYKKGLVVIERRSGLDRRQSPDGNGPGGINRRSGQDRRRPTE